VERRNNFDLLRLIAAVQVMGFHVAGHLNLPLGPLFAPFSAMPGVVIFFVISGYLVSSSLERSSTLGAYLLARFLRIYPALWVCLGIAILLATAWGGVRASAPELIPWLVAQLSIGQFYNPQFLRGFGTGVLNGSLWTIPVELQFYLFLPCFYALLRRVQAKNALLIGLILVFAGVHYFYATLSAERSLAVKVLGVTLFPYLYLFLLGVLLQRNPHWVARFLAGKSVVWIVIFAATSCAMGWLGLEIYGNTLNPVSALVLGLTVVSIAYARPRSLGGYDLSYGIYIYHMIFVNAVLHAGRSSVAAAAFVIGATFLLAFCSWVFIETPALGLKHAPLARRLAERLIGRRPNPGQLESAA
jgi:peptidoglycan/LPS O-acetylase OafA/YrhL